MAIAAADPAPAAVITCARGSAAFPAAHTPGGAGRAGPVDGDEAGLVELAAEPRQQTIFVRHDRWADEHGRPGDHLAVGERDPGEAIGFDHQPSDLPVDDPYPSGIELQALGVGQSVGVGEEDDVVGPLPHQLRVLDGAWVGAEDSDGLVADLPSVAVRAVQEISAPALTDPAISGSSS